VSTEPYSLETHDAYEGVEHSFNETLDRSLKPRGPDMLYGLVAELGLEPGAAAVDVGCGPGRHAIELARRFGLAVIGVDPAARRIELAGRLLAEVAATEPALAGSARFELGRAESLPLADASADLVWCRDVLTLVKDLAGAYREFRRVLKPGGHVLVYQAFLTERMEPREAAWLLPVMGGFEANMRPEYTEVAIRSAGLRIDRSILLGSEWGEYDQEQTGQAGAQAAPRRPPAAGPAALHRAIRSVEL
jgi:SAM-dependent methyltransferase